MNNNQYIKQIFAGLFFLIGLGVMASVIYFIGFQKGLTEPKFEMQVLFKDVSGLNEGAPVRLSGVTVGTVGDIDFLEQEIFDHGLVVKLDLFKKYKDKLKKGTTVGIKTEGVLGEAYIDISADPRLKPINLSSPVIGQGPLDIYDMAKVLDETATSFKDTADGINQMMTELRYITSKTKRLFNRIEQRVIDGNLFKVF